MTEINVSAHTPYHTQINNVYFPLSTCNTTSAIMWLLDCGIEFPREEGVQPEDALTALTETPQAYAFMRQSAPWAFDTHGRPLRPPREIHICLCWAVNRFVGREVMRFRADATYQELVAELSKGKAALLSGVFTRKGHMVCLVGVRTVQAREELCGPGKIRVDQIKGFLVDDPYGDYHSGYHDCRGNDVFFSLDEIDRLTRELYQNRKWAHVFVG